MPTYIRAPNNVSVNNVTALYQFGITDNGVAASEWLVELALMLSMPLGHGGLKFNLRLPADAFGEINGAVIAQADDQTGPVTGLSFAGIPVNKGAIGAATHYLTWDPPGSWSGIIQARWSVKLGTAGPAAFDVARVRTSSNPPTVLTGSILTLRQML